MHLYDYITNKSTIRTSGVLNQALQIMQQYYEEYNLLIIAATMQQSEIDNYLKFWIDKSNESCSSNTSSLCEQEYNSLHFWKHNPSLFSRLVKIARRVFVVSTISASIDVNFF